MILAPLEPDPRQSLTGPRHTLSLAHPLVDQGKFDIFQRGGAWQKVVALKNETEVVPAQQRALIAV